MSGVIGVQIVSGKSNSGLPKQGEKMNKMNKNNVFIRPFIKAPREGTRTPGPSTLVNALPSELHEAFG